MTHTPIHMLFTTSAHTQAPDTRALMDLRVLGVTSQLQCHMTTPPCHVLVSAPLQPGSTGRVRATPGPSHARRDKLSRSCQPSSAAQRSSAAGPKEPATKRWMPPQDTSRCAPARARAPWCPPTWPTAPRCRQTRAQTSSSTCRSATPAPSGVSRPAFMLACPACMHASLNPALDLRTHSVVCAAAALTFEHARVAAAKDCITCLCHPSPAARSQTELPCFACSATCMPPCSSVHKHEPRAVQRHMHGSLPCWRHT